MLAKTHHFVRNLRTRLRDWWNPIWYGDPCAHGVYGHSYNHGIVLECRHCMRELNEWAKEEERKEKAAIVRAAFWPEVEALQAELRRKNGV